MIIIMIIMVIILILILILIIAKLSRAKRAAEHPTDFGSQVTVCPPERQSVLTTGTPLLNNSIRYGNPNATQGFIWKEIAWPIGLKRKKKNNKNN